METAGEKRPCRLSGALSKITSGSMSIQHGTRITTGLTWPEIHPLFCARYSCSFCERIDGGFNPGKRPYWEREDVPYDDAVKFLSKAQLTLCFVARADNREYLCLTLVLEMNNPNIRRPKKSRSFEVVGHFRTPDQGEGSQVVARRVVPAVFDPSILKVWLSTCENDHRHEEVYHDTADSSVAALVAKGRLRLINV